MLEKIHHPSLVAVWPGMGGVAISAGYYLMAKLGMHTLMEFPSEDFFEIEKIQVEHGLIQATHAPRNRLFIWSDPNKQHDLILFIGEAQPPTRGASFCRQIINRAMELGVHQVITFAAMATEMRPKHDSRVFCAAIDPPTLKSLRNLSAEPLESGSISGLNGVFLNMAAEHGMTGGCLLGEIPMIFSQIPFPKASLAVLEKFKQSNNIPLDLTELRTQAKKVEFTLEDFLTRIEKNAATIDSVTDPHPPASPEPSQRDHIEKLFRKAATDRSHAYELKQELDRLKLFSKYEDRFLDLFRDIG
ncbi:MAG: PAC2 family protein [Verrucomicrobiota bacterium JB025]|nr:PAC2 family protein [Verrucomicrobiota bacterium JB025]